jgi:hypothetical protein
MRLAVAVGALLRTSSDTIQGLAVSDLRVRRRDRSRRERGHLQRG